MSFLNRIQSRSIGLNNLIKPKGFARRMASKEEQPVEEEVQTLHRQEEVTEKKPEEVQAVDLKRNVQDEGSNEEVKEEEQTAQLHRRSHSSRIRRVTTEDEKAEEPQEEEAQSLHRQPLEHQEEEPIAQTVRRQVEEPQEEESARPLRREILEHNEEEAAQAVRRQNQEESQEEAVQAARSPSPANLNVENSEQPEELSEEPTESTVTALRRETNTVSPDAPVSIPAKIDWSLPEPLTVSDPISVSKPAIGDTTVKPTVQIDQIDVLVQEPAMSTFRRSGANHTRAIRTRYLRRL